MDFVGGSHYGYSCVDKVYSYRESKMKKFDILELVVKIVTIVSAIIIIYWGIELLFGGSPSLSEFNSMFIVMIMGVLFMFAKSFSKFNREVGEMKVDVKHSFNNMKRDMGEIKNDMEGIKKKLGVK